MRVTVVGMAMAVVIVSSVVTVAVPVFLLVSGRGAAILVMLVHFATILRVRAGARSGSRKLSGQFDTSV